MYGCHHVETHGIVVQAKQSLLKDARSGFPRFTGGQHHNQLTKFRDAQTQVDDIALCLFACYVVNSKAIM